MPPGYVHLFAGHYTSGLTRGRDGALYGTTFGNPDAHLYGTVFRMTPEGTISTLYRFTTYGVGAYPNPSLVMASDGMLYGTTLAGGAYGFGTVFRVSTTGEFRYIYGSSERYLSG